MMARAAVPHYAAGAMAPLRHFAKKSPGKKTLR
jgi:hypothetical protein